MARAKVTTFTVRGTDPFPWDMLRYDEASPTDKGVQVLMHRYDHMRFLRRMTDEERQAAFAESRGAFEIELRCDGEPTTDRWRSFGWTITESRAY